MSGQRCQPGAWSPHRCVQRGLAGFVCSPSTASVSPSALWCPPCLLDPGVWSTLSLKGVDLGLPCHPSRTGCGKNGTRGVKMGIYQSSGSVTMNKTTAMTLMSQFGSELSFQGVVSNSVDKEPLHGFTQLWVGSVHGRSGEGSWGLRETLGAQAQFGAVLEMTHDQHNSKACGSTRADSSPGGTAKGHRDELRKHPGCLDMPQPCVSPSQELLGALQNSVQHPPELLWLSRDPQPRNHLHEPSPPPLSAFSQGKQRKAIPASLCFFFSLFSLSPQQHSQVSHSPVPPQQLPPLLTITIHPSHLCFGSLALDVTWDPAMVSPVSPAR